MATQPQPNPPQPAPPPSPKPEDEEKERAAKAKKLFDDAEKDDGPVTSQTDGIRRSLQMEQVGVQAWMAEQERRIRERQGDPPVEPRQVHGVAVAVKH